MIMESVTFLMLQSFVEDIANPFLLLQFLFILIIF